MKLDRYLRNMRPVVTIFCFVIVQAMTLQVYAQKKMVEYTTDFEFREGIYLSIADFKDNRPVPLSRIVFPSNRNDKDFLHHVLDKTTVTYTDSAGKKQEIKTNDLWGYSSNGNVHVNYGTGFCRVTVIGSICHFVATVPVRLGMSDPFYYNEPFDNRVQYTYSTEQMIIDFESGKAMPFSVSNMEALLSRDEALYNEFMALKKKQKRDSVFVYLRKYNNKHPVFFPE